MSAPYHDDKHLDNQVIEIKHFTPVLEVSVLIFFGPTAKQDKMAAVHGGAELLTAWPQKEEEGNESGVHSPVTGHHLCRFLPPTSFATTGPQLLPDDIPDPTRATSL